MKTLSTLMSVALLALVPPRLFADPAPLDNLGGRVQAEVNGETLLFPVLKTAIDADISGDLATVTVTQTFENPTTAPLHARYLFPLNREAAVFEMIMRVGNEEIVADIQRVEEAEATFQQAKREGKSAALLKQQRPNMFTQDIAHLMPGLPIQVQLRYVQPLPRVDGEYELVIPLVVGPRFQPPGAGEVPDLHGPSTGQSVEGGVRHWDMANPPAVGADPAASDTAFGQWELQALPAYPPVDGLTIPATIDAGRVSLEIHLDAGMAVQALRSPSHALDASALDDTRWQASLAGGNTLDNRDFVLRYRLAGTDNQAGMTAYRDERGGFFSLLLEPPARPAEVAITPREMVFLLDTSGSMAGLPMEASKAFMRRALQGLRPTDHFRIIRFSDSATEFASQPLPATPANIQQGIAYVDRLKGSGGTMMDSGIRLALGAPLPPDTLRLVTFLTDGYIGNEADLLRLVATERNGARLFAFGVGSAVNRYLLAELGRVGRGFTRFMDPTEDPQAVVMELARRLQSPVLTDIRIDWGSLAATEVSPEPIPDLFAGDSLRLLGRYTTPGIYEIAVHGQVNGQPARLPLRVSLPERGEQGEALALAWARGQIAKAMHGLVTPRGLRDDGQSDDELKARIVHLGLDYSLVTRWTAFVAVSRAVYNPDPASAATRPVPLPQVAGVSRQAYGNTPNHVGGASTPEPAVWLGLLVVAVGLWFGRGGGGWRAGAV